jgi:hypothetical protein
MYAVALAGTVLAGFRSTPAAGNPYAPSLGTMLLTTVPSLGEDAATHNAGLRALERSKADARIAAARCLGLPSERIARTDIDVDGVGGASGGLMLALEIVDRLVREDLARGRRVAGTGTIAPDGRVGPVGGIAHKVAVAEDVGADFFLVPAEQFDEAEIAAVRVHVVPVSDLDDALFALLGRGCAS